LRKGCFFFRCKNADLLTTKESLRSYQNNVFLIWGLRTAERQNEALSILPEMDQERVFLVFLTSNDPKVSNEVSKICKMKWMHLNRNR